MNVYIMGGGRVGFHLAGLLSEEDYEVTVIEKDPVRREQLDMSLNARVVFGDGSSALVLQDLSVGDADLFVACAGNDADNLIAAAVAKGLGARLCVARVAKKDYVENNYLYEGFLNIDYLLSPDALVAQEIASYILSPGLLASEEFARGHIQMRQVQVGFSAPAVGSLLQEILSPGSGVLVGMVQRNGDTFIPRGNFRIAPGDKVTLLGRRETLPDALKDFQGPEPRMQRIVIMGGGAIGVYIAQALEGKVEIVKLFEKQHAHAEMLAAGLPAKNIHVICRDASTREALEQEHIDTFDIFIATTEDDERNIVAGVLAREVGVQTVAAVVHQPDFAPLVMKLGIEIAVTPRSAVANRIVRILRQQTVTASTLLGEGEAEVLEFDLGEGCPVLGKPLREISASLPRNTIIATIARGDSAIVPGGADILASGDTLVIISKAESSEAARRFLQGR